MLTESARGLRHIMPQLARPSLLVLALSLLIAGVNHFHPHLLRDLAIPNLPLTLMGAALGAFVGFRNSSAYGRWWEARILWGQLINASRTLARQARSLLAPCEEAAERRDILLHLGAFVASLRLHLLRQDPVPALRTWLSHEVCDDLSKTPNVPAAILVRLGQIIAQCADKGLVTEQRLQQFDRSLTALTDVQGGCERIKNTPLPRQYDYIPELLLRAYCFLLPLALAESLGWATPAVALPVSAALFALNAIGKNLEDPFEGTVHGTPMAALVRTVERELRWALDEPALPPLLVPVDGVLD